LRNRREGKSPDAGKAFDFWLLPLGLRLFA